MQPLQPPPPIPTPDGQVAQPPPAGPRQRGGCLTAYLILTLITSPIMGVWYLLFGSSVAAMLPQTPAWTIPVLGVMALLHFVFGLAVWQWKRWGVYGFVVMSIAGFLINAATSGVMNALTGLIGLIIIIALVRPIWHEME
jgi:hypothetical protein